MDTLETAAGDSTPVLLPPDLEGESPTESPDEKPPMEVFDLQESSSESISPDMESHALFIKLKEVSPCFCQKTLLKEVRLYPGQTNSKRGYIVNTDHPPVLGVFFG